MMPGMSGMEFADKVASRLPALRARMLFITGGAMMPAAESFLARPDVRHLLKPLNLKTLVAELEDMLGVSASNTATR
jgi:CheY-like chemotaxis protein